jgi:hypothetical protein
MAATASPLADHPAADEFEFVRETRSDAVAETEGSNPRYRIYQYDGLAIHEPEAQSGEFREYRLFLWR